MLLSIQVIFIKEIDKMFNEILDDIQKIKKSTWLKLKE